MLILAVPKTRNLLRSQIEESRAEQTNFFPLYGAFSMDKSEAQKFMKLTKDPTVKMTLFLGQLAGAPHTEKEIINEYDHLRKQYPRNLWLIKRRLVESVYYNFKIPMDPALLKRVFPDALEKIYNVDNQVYLRGIPRALQIAKYGEKLEPENSFYDWMQATFLFSQGKTQVALQALERGSHKKYFNDGFNESNAAAVTASKLIGKNLFEEKLVAHYSLVLGNTLAISQTNMAAIGQGALAEQQENQQHALQIYSAQLRLCAQMLTAYNGIGYSNMVNNLAINVWLSKNRYQAWQKQKPLKTPGVNYSYSDEKGLLLWRTKTASALFARYAIDNNRPDVGAMAQQLSHDLYVKSDVPLYHQIDSLTNSLYGKTRIRLIFQLKWIGMQLLLSLELLIPILLLISLPVNLALRKYRDIRSAVNRQITSVNVISGTIFALCVFAFLLAFALAQAVTSYYYYDFFANIPDRQIDYINILKGYIKTYYWWIPFVACYIYCAVSTLWKCRKSTFVHEIQSVILTSIKEEKLKKISRGISIAHQIFYWIIVLLIELFLFSLQLMIKNNYAYVLIPITLVIAFIIWWFAKNIHLPAPALFTGTYWLLFATWLQRSLALLILIFTLAYGVTSWASLPLRHDANITLDHVLKVGEVAALREALVHDKAQSSNNTTAP